MPGALLQTKDGKKPSAFVADEWQEWLRLRAIPAMNKAAKAHFRDGANQWFSAKAYAALKAAVGWDKSRPLYLLAHDQDPRHSMRDMAHYRHELTRTAHPEDKDRRSYPKGTGRWIELDADKQYVPTAPRVPDTVQQPIELLFSNIKPAVKQATRHMLEYSVYDMIREIELAFDRYATPDGIAKAFAHAHDSLRIWSGKEGRTVEVRGVTFYCTHGGWVQRRMRA